MPPLNTLLADEQLSDFERLYNKHKNEAYHIAFRILADSAAAEDAVADGFLSIARCFKTVSSLDAHKQHRYIIVTITNAANMILRKNKSHLDDVEFRDDEHVPDEVITLHDKLWIKECMKRLCQTDKEILYLRYALQLDHSEIALTLGISREASRKRLQKAKHSLKQLLEKEGLE